MLVCLGKRHKHTLPTNNSQIIIDHQGEGVVVTAAHHDCPSVAGERKRLAVAAGIIALPSVLLLDEPTSGLDASAALTLMR